MWAWHGLSLRSCLQLIHLHWHLHLGMKLKEATSAIWPTWFGQMIAEAH